MGGGILKLHKPKTGKAQFWNISNRRTINFSSKYEKFEKFLFGMFFEQRQQEYESNFSWLFQMPIA